MTEQEFREFIEKNFWPWISKTERPLSSWLVSLESWAEGMYHEAYKKENG